MNDKELLRALNHVKVQTGSLVCCGCGHEYKCGLHGCAILRAVADRLRELAQADREDRVVVLPCKVGDTVYYIAKTKHGFRYVNSHPFGVDDFTWFNIHFGKTVFLTREEAEAALAGGGGDE